MRVKLLTRITVIEAMERIAALAALTCHANADREFVAPDVLGRIITLNHESILEHITSHTASRICHELAFKNLQDTGIYRSVSKAQDIR